MDYQKQIVKTIQCLTGKFSLWQIWQDFVIVSAVCISNILNFSQEREEMYFQRIGKYNQTEHDMFAEMLSYTIAAYRSNWYRYCDHPPVEGEVVLGMYGNHRYDLFLYRDYRFFRVLPPHTYHNNRKCELMEFTDTIYYWTRQTPTLPMFEM